jgi:hypothetical protein
MRKEAVVLSLLIAFSILYFDLIFYNGFEITEKYGSKIQKVIFGIDSTQADAQIND